MRLKFAVLCFALLFSCRHDMPTPPGDGQEDQLPQWPVWGGNLRHTANANDPVEYYVGPSEGVEVWSRKLSGLAGGSPSIHSDGTIYVGSGPANEWADSGFVYAFYPNGDLKWRFRTGAPVQMSGAVGQDGTYFIGDYKGTIYAITVQGKLKWRFNAPSAFVGGHPAITIHQKVAFAATKDLIALDSQTGELFWKLPLQSKAGHSVITSKDGHIYLGGRQSILALNEDGEIIWVMAFPIAPREILIGKFGTLYCQMYQDSSIYAINPDGHLKWKFNLGARSNFNIPGLSMDEKIYAIKPVTPQFLIIINEDGNEFQRINLVKISGDEDGVVVNYSSPVIDSKNTIYLSFVARNGGFSNFFSICTSGHVNWRAYIAPETLYLYEKPAISPQGRLFITSDFNLHCIQ